MASRQTNSLLATGQSEDVHLSLLNLVGTFCIQRGEEFKLGRIQGYRSLKTVRICVVSRHTLCQKQMDSFGPREQFITNPPLDGSTGRWPLDVFQGVQKSVL